MGARPCLRIEGLHAILNLLGSFSRRLGGVVELIFVARRPDELR